MKSKCKSCLFIAAMVVLWSCEKKAEQVSIKQGEKEAQEELSGYAKELAEKTEEMNGRPILKENLALLLSAITNRDKQYVAKHIIYPIRIGGGYPLDSIRNRQDMLRLYDKIFDDSLCNVMKQHQNLSEYEWSWYDNDALWLTTLCSGDYLWFTANENDNCSIISVNYASSWVEKERERLLKEEISSLHESLQAEGMDVKEVPFIARIDKHTTWFCRIDILEENDGMEINGEKYLSRLTIYRNKIGYGQKPDYVYYGYETSGTGPNRGYTFYNKEGKEAAAFSHMVLIGDEQEAGDFLYLKDDKPIKCKRFLWRDKIRKVY